VSLLLEREAIGTMRQEELSGWRDATGQKPTKWVLLRLGDESLSWEWDFAVLHVLNLCDWMWHVV